MAIILLVEDGAGVGRELTSLLAAAGHRVLRRGGGPTPLTACLLRRGRCPLPDAAELLVFACTLALPPPGRSYRGIHLLRAYRAHPDYGRLPLVLVAVAPPQNLQGPGTTAVVDRPHYARDAVSAAAPGTDGRSRHAAGPRLPTGSSAVRRTTARRRRWRSCSCTPGS